VLLVSLVLILILELLRFGSALLLVGDLGGSGRRSERGYVRIVGRFTGFEHGDEGDVDVWCMDGVSALPGRGGGCAGADEGVDALCGCVM
jgi:hypothetical protein